jgi:hypothetical protein
MGSLPWPLKCQTPTEVICNRCLLLHRHGEGLTLVGHMGVAAPEVEQVYIRARELCQQVGQTSQLFTVLQGLSGFYAVRGKLRTVSELVEQRLKLARRQQAPALPAQAHMARGHSLLASGGVASARAHLEQGMALYDPEQHHLGVGRTGVVERKRRRRSGLFRDVRRSCGIQRQETRACDEASVDFSGLA